jgi:hypothetical protein
MRVCGHVRSIRLEAEAAAHTPSGAPRHLPHFVEKGSLADRAQLDVNAARQSDARNLPRRLQMRGVEHLAVVPEVPDGFDFAGVGLEIVLHVPPAGGSNDGDPEARGDLGCGRRRV